MTHNTTTLLLGSDLGDKNYYLKTAKDLIIHEVGEIVVESSIIETVPIGFTSNTTFLNQIISVETLLTPFQLLKQLKSIEYQMGRVYPKPKKNEQYSSRIIDLDILYFGKLKLYAPQLLIPHPQIYTRSFVKELLNTIQMI